MKTLIHIFIWSIYVCFPLYILPTPSQIISSNAAFFQIYILKSLVSILFFYFTYRFTIPFYFQKKKYLVFSVFTILFIAVFTLITQYVISLFTENIILNEMSEHFVSSTYKMRFVIITIASFSLYYYERYHSLKHEKINSELLALKAQINPHFLFNTLNGIYGLSLSGSQNTSDSILKLASIMRHILTVSTTDKVRLTQELEYINDYIELQRIRLSKTKVNFEVHGEIKNQQIPPLLFINFIENAFKYGVSNEEETIINIKISVQEKCVLLFVENDKTQSDINLVESSNIGMPNIKKRLSLLYGNNYDLHIRDKEDKYELSLKINLYD